MDGEPIITLAPAVEPLPPGIRSSHTARGFSFGGTLLTGIPATQVTMNARSPSNRKTLTVTRALGAESLTGA